MVPRGAAIALDPPLILLRALSGLRVLKVSGLRVLKVSGLKVLKGLKVSGLRVLKVSYWKVGIRGLES